MKPDERTEAGSGSTSTTTDDAARASAASEKRRTEGAVLDEIEGLKRRTATLEQRAGVTAKPKDGDDQDDQELEVEQDDPAEPGEYLDLDRFLFDQPKPEKHFGSPWKTRRGKYKAPAK